MLHLSEKYFTLHSHFMKRPFLTQKIVKVQHNVRQFRKNPKKPSNVLRLKKAYVLKISQSIIYVKKYF